MVVSACVPSMYRDEYCSHQGFKEGFLGKESRKLGAAGRRIKMLQAGN